MTVDNKIKDYGSTYGPGSATHSLTLYKAASGALVFGAGTVQWAWGLDSLHDGPQRTPDPRMQQATVNLFADMGVQPGALQTNLVAAAASTDTTAPTSVITSPSCGSSVPRSSEVTVQGTASDVGGQVGGVEVSVDGGVDLASGDWHDELVVRVSPQPATSRTIVLSRAVDDSAQPRSQPPGRLGSLDRGRLPCRPLAGHRLRPASRRARTARRSR